MSFTSRDHTVVPPKPVLFLITRLVSVACELFWNPPFSGYLLLYYLFRTILVLNKREEIYPVS